MQNVQPEAGCKLGTPLGIKDLVEQSSFVGLQPPRLPVQTKSPSHVFRKLLTGPSSLWLPRINPAPAVVRWWPRLWGQSLCILYPHLHMLCP